MTIRKTLYAAFAATLFLVAGCQDSGLVSVDTGTETDAKNGDIIPGRFIVVVSSDPAIAGKEPLAVARDLAGLRGVAADRMYGSSVIGFAGAISGEALRTLRADRRVSLIEPDRVVVLPPIEVLGGNKGKKPGGGGGTQPPQVTPWGITRVGGFVDRTGMTACVIDTGIDLDHPDLNVSETQGFSAFSKGRDAGFDDGHGHGTHVSGTIAALDNGIGVVGVAAGATVVPIKVLSSRGSGSNSGVIAGVDWVAANAANAANPDGCDVANMSLGGGVSTALDNAVVAASANLRFVLAAGNDTDDADNHSPARVNSTNVFTISAFDSNDNFASFSNYGAAVDYAAPGVAVTSTFKDGEYATWDGTSMAAPHAAGVLLLGDPVSDGFVIGDRDEMPDPIISHATDLN